MRNCRGAKNQFMNYFPLVEIFYTDVHDDDDQFYVTTERQKNR